jgi:glycosyltransferase involved in cell wall biosynthesis
MGCRRVKSRGTGKGGMSKNYDLIILDDHVPRPFSSFRIAEFNYLLREIPNSIILSSATSFAFEKVLSVVAKYFPGLETVCRKLFRPLDFKLLASGYCRDHPGNKKRIGYIDPSACRVTGKMAYLVFINNAHKFIDYLETNDIDFVFTLYPGGGFRLDDEECDRKLSRVFGSKNFRSVIATQSATKEYLLKKKFCREEQIVAVFGGVFPSDYFDRIENKSYYPADKAFVDICFVANKYSAQGIDKGYDLFIAAAHLLKDREMVRFHVVGDFNEDDMDVSALEGRVAFYGQQPSSFFRRFYPAMDMILSPNRPFVLAPGAFDGFPTGCCIEAGLCGVAVFCTDPLDLNPAFSNHTDIVIIPDDAQSIVSILTDYLDHPDKLYSLARRVQGKFKEVFDIDAQMAQRIVAVKNVPDEAVRANVARSL